MTEHGSPKNMDDYEKLGREKMMREQAEKHQPPPAATGATPETDAAEDRCRECGLSFVPREDMAKIERESAINMENFKVTNRAYVKMDERRIELERELAEAKAIAERQMNDAEACRIELAMLKADCYYPRMNTALPNDSSKIPPSRRTDSAGTANHLGQARVRELEAQPPSAAAPDTIAVPRSSLKLWAQWTENRVPRRDRENIDCMLNEMKRLLDGAPTGDTESDNAA